MPCFLLAERYVLCPRKRYSPHHSDHHHKRNITNITHHHDHNNDYNDYHQKNTTKKTTTAKQTTTKQSVTSSKATAAPKTAKPAEPTAAPQPTEAPAPTTTKVTTTAAPKTTTTKKQAKKKSKKSDTKKTDTPKQLRAAINGASGDDTLNTFGSAYPTDKMLKALKKQVKALSANGHYVSVMMIDIGTMSGITYCPDRVMCTQSTIKALYIGALLDNDPSLFQKHKDTIKKAIELSDNEAYESLINTYGRAPLEKWCKECGVDKDFADLLYPKRTVREMCLMWTKMYDYLTNDAPDELKGYFTNSLFSAAKEQLGSRCYVQSKAGWENGVDVAYYSEDITYPADYIDKDPYNDECAINDTGFVTTDTGTYIFAVFTDYPYAEYTDYTPPNPLLGLTEAIYNFHLSMTTPVLPEEAAVSVNK